MHVKEAPRRETSQRRLPPQRLRLRGPMGDREGAAHGKRAECEERARTRVPALLVCGIARGTQGLTGHT
eukprot:699712-Alexandrium_andersonii.AAC.1